MAIFFDAWNIISGRRSKITTTLKTINNTSVFGEGNITAGGGGFSGTLDDITDGATYKKVSQTEKSNFHAPGSDNQDLSGKVDKVTGSSLLADTEAAKIHSPGSDNQDLSNLVVKVTGKALSTNDLTDLLKTAYDNAVAASHAHSNKSTLDSIQEALTTALKTAYDSAVTNNHTHSNKATLDSITAAFTTALKATYDGYATTIAGKTDIAAVLADVGIADAITKKHASGSDAETQTSISAIINAQAEKTTPVDADMTELQDSAAANVMKRLSWLNVKATLKTYFDTLYNGKRLVSNLAASVVTSGTTEKVLLQLAIPANRAVVGSCFRATVMGNSSSTGTLIFKVREGAGGVITDAVAWTAITSAAQAANKRAGFDVIIIVRDSTHNYTDGMAYAGTLQLETVIAVPATSIIAINGIWYISLTVICSSGTFTAQVGAIEEIK
jgi:hypothetical protein